MQTFINLDELGLPWTCQEWADNTFSGGLYEDDGVTPASPQIIDDGNSPEKVIWDWFEYDLSAQYPKNIFIDHDMKIHAITEIDMSSEAVNEIINQMLNNLPAGCTDQAACNYDSNALADDGSCLYNDCSGECGGSAVEDCTGVCNGSAVEDCTGACNGTAVEDCTGVCNGTAVEDCTGVCNGTAVEDCLGACEGTAIVDDCGVCDGGNADQDCAGECGGSAVEDCLGICEGTAVEDCEGECGGSASDQDEDGICDEVDNCINDAGNWFSNSITDYDSDGCQDDGGDLDDDNDGLIDCWNYWPVDGVLLTDTEKNDLIDLEECQDFALGYEKNILPASIELLNIFPNPFNPSSTISFNLNYPQIVNIDIYDINGQKLVDLTDKFYNSGTHNLEWKPDASISSSLYLVHFQTVDFQTTQKILYLK